MEILFLSNGITISIFSGTNYSIQFCLIRFTDEFNVYICVGTQPCMEHCCRYNKRKVRPLVDPDHDLKISLENWAHAASTQAAGLTPPASGLNPTEIKKGTKKTQSKQERPCQAPLQA